VAIILLVVIAVAAVVALARGGSLDRLAETDFRFGPLLLIALIVQFGLDLWNPPWLSEAGDLTVLLVTNLAVAIFLFVNRRLPGMLLAAAGMLLNVIVITANGGMPVSERAAEIAQMPITEVGIKHELLTDQTRLPWVADVIPVPVVRRVISPGDVLLMSGIALLVYGRATAAKRWSD
jgi:Family of unknown function (DUF5317)